MVRDRTVASGVGKGPGLNSVGVNNVGVKEGDGSRVEIFPMEVAVSRRPHPGRIEEALGLGRVTATRAAVAPQAGWAKPRAMNKAFRAFLKFKI